MIDFIKTLIVIIAMAMLGLVIKDYVIDYKNAYESELTSVAKKQGEDVEVYIPEDASANEIATILKKNGLIRFKSAFVKRLKESEYRGKIQSGTYTLNTGMNTLAMMAEMSPVIEENGPIDHLTVPEGFTVDLIAARCEKQGICTAEEFKNAAKSVTVSQFPYLEDVPAGAPVRYKVEGYLFPATYDIYENTTAESLVDWMLKTFENRYDEGIKARAEELGYNSYEVITRASIIERECSVPEERATIAGVINNRLKAGMLLQIDPTFLYPLTKGMYDKEESTYEDTEYDSKYNTYVYSGLPVGPICNPGMDCIEAVLYPEEHSYYYYHTSDANDGSHIFTETYEEHLESQ